MVLQLELLRMDKFPKLLPWIKSDSINPTYGLTPVK